MKLNGIKVDSYKIGMLENLIFGVNYMKMINYLKKNVKRNM